MSTSAAPAVDLAGVTKRFGDVVAVDAIDCTIGQGEFFTLLGPSGCGKTTTLRMIAGLDFPTEGSLRIHGTEVGTLPPEQRPVNTVFQHYALFPHLDVTANIGFGLRMRRTPRAEAARRVAEAISLVRLDGLGHRRPSELSGGQQQRVALARALVNRPKVLLLDEPLGALDLKLRQQMQAELEALQREVGITFVLVTHDQEEALAMSHRIGVMHEGRLLQVGTPEEIYEHPSSRFVADFIGRTNLLEGTVVDATTVCLLNGARIPAHQPHERGERVFLSLRPERTRMMARGRAPDGLPSLDGVLDSATYLGNALVYRVALDWMSIEVRAPTRTEHDPLRIGDEVTVFWAPDAASVVTER